ncbi:MAG: type IX secretion system protein PorQ [Bacteroidia bacterium]
MRRFLRWLGVSWVHAQVAGGWGFDFLQMAPSAYVAAMGNVAPLSTDLSAAVVNPSLLRPTHHKNLLVTYTDYLADIHAGTVLAAWNKPLLGTFWAGIHYLNYGTIRKADIFGNVEGQFTVQETSLQGGAVRHFGRFHTGMNFKVAYSGLENYHVLGLGTDIGLSYDDTTRNLTACVTLRNVGTTLWSTSPSAKQRFPTQVQLGISYKLPKAPFRLHLSAIHAQRFRMAYNDPAAPKKYDLLGNPLPESPPKWTENLLRHWVMGLTFEPGKVFQVRMSYHFQRRRELNAPGSNALGGIALGFSLRLSARLGLDYAYTLFARRAATNTFSLRFSFQKS